MKICLACSAGGHLTEIRKLEKLYSKYDYFFVTYFSDTIKYFAKQEKFYFVKYPKRNIFNFLINILQSFKIFIAERPDVIISTGAGVAIAMCWLGRVFGKKVVFIESWCRIKQPSLTGRLVYPVANLFIIQWKQLQRYYPNAEYRGGLF
jgi:UDP-N-acetylglucosamine:LPS N-acetylglucosamine transferase